MTKNEFMKVASAIRTYYPRENPLPNAEAAQLWYEEFKEIPYEDAVAGLRRHVNTSKWCPTIAELKEAIVVNTAGEKDWGSLWDECIQAIHRYGYCGEKEAMESISPLTKQIVTRLGYRQLCMSEDQMADRANFRMIYEQVANKEYERAALSETLRKKIAAFVNRPLELGGNRNGDTDT